MAIKTLIVDDEEDILQELSTALSNAGMIVFTAKDGRKALDVLKRQDLDVIVTDIRMPDINGIELLLYAKELNPDIKVIVITAYGSEAVRREVLEKGAIGYLEKPFDVKDLIDLINSLAKKPGTEEWGITEILQLINLDKKSAILTVKTPEGEGKIYIVDGDVYHAELGELSGKEAFLKIISYERPKFDIKWTTPKVKRTIVRPLYLLLLEAIVGPSEVPETLLREEKVEEEKKEEAVVEESPLEKALEQIGRLFREVEPEEEAALIETAAPAAPEAVAPPQPERVTAPPPQPTPAVAPTKKIVDRTALDSLLQSLIREMPDIIAIAVVDANGSVLSQTTAANLNIDVATVSRFLVTGFSGLATNVVNANLGNMHEVLISTPASYILIRALKGSSYLIGILPTVKEISLGLFRLKMNKLSTRLEEVLA